MVSTKLTGDFFVDPTEVKPDYDYFNKICKYMSKNTVVLRSKDTPCTGLILTTQHTIHVQIKNFWTV